MADRTKALEMLAGQMLAASMGANVTWDEAVAAFGLAAKALATKAAAEGDGTPESCQSLAKKRLDESFARDVQVAFACSDIATLRAAYQGEPPVDLGRGSRIFFAPGKKLH